jgi:hypothetical protein
MKRKSSNQIGINFYLLHLLLAGCLLTGCQDDSGDKIFADTGSKIAQAWDKAKYLDAENDYMPAAEAYDLLRQMNLTHKQTKAVELAIGKLYVRLRRAAEAGDANAKKILEGIQENSKKSS